MPTVSRRQSAAEARRRARHAADAFTDREIEILQAMVDHGGTALAAAALGRSEHTVKGALETMRSKAGLQATYQLTLVAAHRLTPPNVALQKRG